MLDYKISIIIPVYNVEKYIERAMQSLFEQTIGFENLQVIFVDDCSTDKSWDIVCEFNNKYENVFAYRLSKNSGSAGVPRNKGLEYVKAKYVMFLDPDDFYYENACEILYNEIENNDVDFVSACHNRTKVSDNGIDVDLKNITKCDSLKAGIYYDVQEDMSKIIDYRGVFFEKIYRMDLISSKKILFADNIAGEDTYFLCKYILESKKVKYIDNVIYCYILRKNSITFTVSKNFLFSISECYQRCYKLFIDYNKENCFKVLVKWVIDDYFNALLDSNINNYDAIDVLQNYYWLCSYYSKSNLLVRSEYNNILLNTVLACNSNLLFCVYKNLRIIKKYVLELEYGKAWFLEQIDNKDKEIGNLIAANTKLTNCNNELENSKEWFLKQISNQDKEIENYKQGNKELKRWTEELEKSKVYFLEQIKFKDEKIKKLEIVKSYYEQPFYKRLFSKKPIFTEEN